MDKKIQEGMMAKLGTWWKNKKETSRISYNKRKLDKSERSRQSRAREDDRKRTAFAKGLPYEKKV